MLAIRPLRLPPITTFTRFPHRVREYTSNDRGAVAVEFGLTAVPFILTLLAAIQVGYSLYIQDELDRVTQKAGRAVMTGVVQNLDKQLTADEFRTTYVCPNLPSSISCGDVIVNLQTVTAGTGGFSQYYTAKGLVAPTLDNSKTGYCLGGGGAYVLLQVAYPMPLISGVFADAISTTYKGKKVMLRMSSVAFKNEPFSAPNYSIPTGCA